MRVLMKFLVIDQSYTMRQNILTILRNLGYNDFIEATDGRDGFEKLVTHRPDLIIMDLNIPDVSLKDFIQAVRTSPEFRHLPILAITTRELKRDLLRRLYALVDTYLEKPFTPEMMRQKIHQILNFG